LNIFLASLETLKSMLHAHHLPYTDKLSVDQARHAVLSHLACIGVCDEVVDVRMHKCCCTHFRHLYDSRQSMAFGSLSIILSASPERLPQEHM
jgi:hypothetical protein